MPTIFFTDSVLASSISSTDGVLQEYVVSDEVRLALQTLRERGRLGIIVHVGNQLSEAYEHALKKAGLLSMFNPELVLFSDGFTPASFAEAVSKGRSSNERLLFVGEHSDERTLALEAGFDTAIPHPLLVTETLSETMLAYVAVSKLGGVFGDNRLQRFLRFPLVPFHVSRENEGSAFIITSTRIAEILEAIGFGVTTFGNEHDPQTTDPYLVRDDRTAPDETTQRRQAIEFLERIGKAQFILGPTDREFVIALPADVSIEEIHFPNALHGHSRRLMARKCLLTPFDRDPLTVRDNSRFKLNTTATLTVTEKETLRLGITPGIIQVLHDPYVGKASLPGTNERIRSRHISRRENALATNALMYHLKTIDSTLLTVQTHNFMFAGAQLRNVEAELRGSDSDSIVIISAHFDSKSVDVNGNFPAPGGDDDASGMAGVLAAAQVAVNLRRQVGPLKRTLRFVFFNAEEDLILGSAQYAAALRAANVPVAAVFQMDMIGFNGGDPTVIEIHAGYAPNSAVEQRSLAVADRIRTVIGEVSPSLENIQIYPYPRKADPAQYSSDHTSFYECGYAGCMISEDYNTDPDDPRPDPQINEHYHKSTDQNIDSAYAAEIARAVAAAAILTAKG